MGLSDNRVTLYIRPRKDDDIREFLANVDKGDRSWLVRDLVRDGIKYRKMVNNSSEGVPVPTKVVSIPATDTPKATPPEVKKASTESVQEEVRVNEEPLAKTITPDFSDIKLQRIEVNTEELNKKLDAL